MPNVASFRQLVGQRHGPMPADRGAVSGRQWSEDRAAGHSGSNAAQPASDCRALFYSGSQCAQLNISPIGKGRKPSVGDEQKSPLSS